MVKGSTKLIRQVCILSALMVAGLVSGCATQAGHGNLDQFILRKVRENGGMGPEVNQAVHLVGHWTFSDDRYGTSIRSSDVTFVQIDQFLRGMYGDIWTKQLNDGSSIYAVPTRVAGVTIWYKKTAGSIEVDINKALPYQDLPDRKPSQ